MTVCIAAICERKSDNPKVILAGDRMVTAEILSVEFEHPDPKLYELSKNCAVATAGDALAHTDLLSKVNGKISGATLYNISEIVKEIKDEYYKKRVVDIEDSILKKYGISSFKEFYYDLHQKLNNDILMSIQQEIEEHDCEFEILTAGVDDSGAHIYHINHPTKAENYDAIGYHAIGIGYPHAASTFISSIYNSDCSLPEALYMTYKAKKISENAPGVGRQSDIWIISKDGKIVVNDEMLNRLDVYYNNELKMKSELNNQLVKERKFDEITKSVESLRKESKSK